MPKRYLDVDEFKLAIQKVKENRARTAKDLSEDGKYTAAAEWHIMAQALEEVFYQISLNAKEIEPSEALAAPATATDPSASADDVIDALDKERHNQIDLYWDSEGGSKEELNAAKRRQALDYAMRLIWDTFEKTPEGEWVRKDAKDR